MQLLCWLHFSAEGFASNACLWRWEVCPLQKYNYNWQTFIYLWDHFLICYTPPNPPQVLCLSCATLLKKKKSWKCPRLKASESHFLNLHQISFSWKSPSGLNYFFGCSIREGMIVPMEHNNKMDRGKNARCDARSDVWLWVLDLCLFTFMWEWRSKRLLVTLAWLFLQATLCLLVWVFRCYVPAQAWLAWSCQLLLKKEW